MIGRIDMAAALAPAGASGAQAADHDRPATPRAVAWTHYDAGAAPVLTVRTGDTAAVHTLLDVIA